jgi:hypothetical protein
MFNWQQKAQQALLPPPPTCHGFALGLSGATQALELAHSKAKVNRLPWRFKLALQTLTWQQPPVWVHHLNLQEQAPTAPPALQSLNITETLPYDDLVSNTLPLTMQSTSHTLPKELAQTKLQNVNTTLTEALIKHTQQVLPFTPHCSLHITPTLLATVTISTLSTSLYTLEDEQKKTTETLPFHPLLCCLRPAQLNPLAIASWQPNAYNHTNLARQQPLLRKALPLQRLPFALQQQLKHNLAKRFQLPLEKIQLQRVYDRIQEQLFCEIDVNETWQLRCLLKQDTARLKHVETQANSFLVVAKQLTVPLGSHSQQDKWLTALFSETDLES